MLLHRWERETLGQAYAQDFNGALQWGAVGDLHRPPPGTFILTRQQCARGRTVASAVAWTTDRWITGREKAG